MHGLFDGHHLGVDIKTGRIERQSSFKKTKRKGKKKYLLAYQHVHAEQERRGAEELGVGQVLNRRILATERVFHACREETARECEQSCAAQAHRRAGGARCVLSSLKPSTNIVIMANTSAISPVEGSSTTICSALHHRTTHARHTHDTTHDTTHNTRATHARHTTHDDTDDGSEGQVAEGADPSEEDERAGQDEHPVHRLQPASRHRLQHVAADQRKPQEGQARHGFSEKKGRQAEGRHDE